MLSKNRAKFIISLQKKRVRDTERLFIVEGDKLVKEVLISAIPVTTLIAKPEFLGALPSYLTGRVNEIVEVSYNELKHISTLKTPHNALAIIPMPERQPDPAVIEKKISLALDFVQDPGNLGTIIRAAAWFGIEDIFCSEDCADNYNPKVIQASMGAILHVRVHYLDLKTILSLAASKKSPVFGTFLDGEPVYDHRLDNKGLILLGNESKGINSELLPFITERIMIPIVGKSKPGIESLNVGMAASVILSEFARRFR